MEWDILGYGIRFPSEGLKSGDKIFMANTGAYDMSMSYGFGRGEDGKEQVETERMKKENSKDDSKDDNESEEKNSSPSVFLIP